LVAGHKPLLALVKIPERCWSLTARLYSQRDQAFTQLGDIEASVIHHFGRCDGD